MPNRTRDDDDSGLSALMAVWADGAYDSTATYRSRNSTKEDDLCSGRGLCIESLGVCDCFEYGEHAFASSDGRGGPGDRGDCGFEISPTGDPRSVWHVDGRTTVTTYTQEQQMQHSRSWGKDFPTSDCPGELGCSGHGHCSGPPSYRCTCSEGWTAADCSERTCPTAKAWFDFPSDNNEAHTTFTECATMGSCDRARYLPPPFPPVTCRMGKGATLVVIPCCFRLRCAMCNPQRRVRMLGGLHWSCLRLHGLSRATALQGSW